MNPKTEQKLLQWFEEIRSDEEVFACSDSYDSDHNSDVQPMSSGNDEPDDQISFSNAITKTPHIGAPAFMGKDDDTIWFHHNPLLAKTKTPRHNIITQLPGVKRVAKDCKTVLDCWKLFFSDETIFYIVDRTNEKLNLMRMSYKQQSVCSPTDFEEMYAFIGVLYLAGVKKAHHLNTSELWDTDGTAPDFFSASMSKGRFHTLVQAIRFDDSSTREERTKQDNMVHVRQIFDNFVQKCKDNYTIGEYATIDEILEPFRGRCKFRQYVANNPAKYGIKIYALVDARTFYVCNMEVYAGEQPEGPFKTPNDTSSVVKRLIAPIDKLGRNVTMDSYFTSLPLFNDLLVNHRLTAVGTISKNKREIPSQLLDVKSRPIKSSMFLYGDKQDGNNCLLLSYIPKKNKNVLMLSTYHNDDAIDHSTKESYKPEVITFYNLTKGGVNVVDRLKSEYSVSRISNRWPLTIFGTLLDIATINSQIIYSSNTDQILTRRAYITELAKKLALPHMIRRASIPTFSLALRQKIQNITGEIARRGEVPPAVDGRIRCSYCPIRKNRFTKTRCSQCTIPICKEHTSVICMKCNDNNNSLDS